MGRGGDGQRVSGLAFYSDNPSSDPADGNFLSVQMLFEKIIQPNGGMADQPRGLTLCLNLIYWSHQGSSPVNGKVNLSQSNQNADLRLCGHCYVPQSSGQVFK